MSEPEESRGGFIIPDSCRTSWVCLDSPVCDDEQLKFLCEDWEE